MAKWNWICYLDQKELFTFRNFVNMGSFFFFFLILRLLTDLLPSTTSVSPQRQLYAFTNPSRKLYYMFHFSEANSEMNINKTEIWIYLHIT